MSVIASVDELDINMNGVTGSLHAPFQNRHYAELLRDRFQTFGTAAVFRG